MEKIVKMAASRRSALALAASGVVAALPQTGRASPARPVDGVSQSEPSDHRRAAERHLHAYMNAFNHGDHALLRQFYADDVVLVIGNGTELRGPQAIIDFYSHLHESTQRTISILRTFPGEDGIAAELESEFLALADAPDFTSGPMQRGDRLYINSFVIYDIQEGRYSRIRAAVYNRMWRRA